MGGPGFTEDQSDRIFAAYFSGMTVREIAVAMGTYKSRVQNHLWRYRSCPISAVPLTRRCLEAQSEEIKRRYLAGDSALQIGAFYGVGYNTVMRVLADGGIAPRDTRQSHLRYPVDETAFDEWTPASAYWYGYILTDGNLSGVGKTISLASKEDEPLDKFVAFIGTPRRGRKDPRTGVRSVRIHSPRMYDRLTQLGLTPRKSLTVEPPSTLPHTLTGHFLRGVSDGDGSISSRQWAIGTASPVFRDWLVSTILKITGVIPWTRTSVPDGVRWQRHPFYRIHVNSIPTRKWLAFMYDGATSDTQLSRKAEAAAQAINFIDRRRRWRS